PPENPAGCLNHRNEGSLLDADHPANGVLFARRSTRMKAEREHVIPLSPPAIAVLERCKELRAGTCSFVFPGARGDAQMSDMTLTKLLRDMKEGVTVHGFRSAFRDWVSEETNYPGEIAEAALAHRVRDKTEAAYRRGNLLEKRRNLMKEWGSYCQD
ncbi:tyrosine-type recombinase/integrase, partial [Sphingobium scionense]